MQKGFSHGVAPDLIWQKPGMTAPEVAELALRKGLCGSDAKDPVSSLANTLAKEVREGRHPDVYAERVGGVLRYYSHWSGSPKGSSVVDHSSAVTVPDETVSIRLPSEKVEIVDVLIEAGQFHTRSEALAWLVSEGIARNEIRVGKVREAVVQIRAIKQSLQ